LTNGTALDDQDCTYIFGDRTERGSCGSRFPCGICKLPPAKRVLIKGVCAKDVEYTFDFDFGVHGTKNGKALFR
jgi:hypothetical protein